MTEREQGAAPAGSRTAGNRVVVGLLAPNGRPREVADEVAGDLGHRLRERLGGEVEWGVEVGDIARAEQLPAVHELVQAALRRRLREHWQLVVGLTDLPLKVGGRPVTAHASATHGVGLVSVPALGAVGVERRGARAVLNVVEGLLGESVDRRTDPGDRGRRGRLAARLREVTGPLGRMRAEDDGTIQFARATIGANARLLVGMVRANEPSRVTLRLSRALAAALGTAAYALTSSSVWMLANGMSWPRLLGLSLGAILATCVVLVLAHGLWQRPPNPETREQVVLVNLATVMTLALAVLTLYLGLFAATGLAGAALIPPDVFKSEVGQPATVAAFVHLAWLGATVATLASGLGSLLESDASVHEAAYRYQPDHRTESDGERER